MMTSELLILFGASFFAATLFPAQSEVILATLSSNASHPDFILLLIATTGNVLGSLINYVLGYYLLKLKDKKYFPISAIALQKATQRYQKWGAGSLLFAWLPIVGDPITVIAGFFKVNIGLFLLLATIGKAARYAVIIGLF